MKPLLKIMGAITLFFACTFLAVKLTNSITIEKITSWLTIAQHTSPQAIGFIVIGFLFADLFIAIPTLTITTLSGYFLGFQNGAIAAFIGMFLAGIGGYGLSMLLGDRLLKTLIKKPHERERAKKSFHKHGFIMILLSRAVPILPEVTACIAGSTNMPFQKFLLAWTLSTLPFALIASFAGSISTLENPKPAVITTIAVSALLWIGWYVFNKKSEK